MIKLMRIPMLSFAAWVGSVGAATRTSAPDPAMEVHHESSSNVEEFRLDSLDVALLRAAAINWDPTETGAPTIDPACPFGSPHAESDLKRLASLSGVRLRANDGPERVKRMQQTLEIVLQVAKLDTGVQSAPDRLFGCQSPLDKIRRLDLAASDDSPMWKRADARQANVALDLTRNHLILLENLATRFTDWNDELSEKGLTATAGIDPKRPYGMVTDVAADIARILGLPRAEGSAAFLTERRRLRALHDDMRAVVIIALANGKFGAGTYVRGSSGMWESKGGEDK
jgi:hypothetical protein